MMKTLHKQENLTYLALWSIMFLTPVLSLSIRVARDSSLSFSWPEVFIVWREFGVFLLVFLIHNFLLAPLFVNKGRKWLYASLTVGVVALFIVFQCSRRPDVPMHHPHADDTELVEQRPMHHPDRHGPHGKRHDRRPHDRRPPIIIGEQDAASIIVLLLMLGLNLGVKWYFKTRNDARQLQQLERQSLEQQLEYLKYQLNPHFLMNTLNNIHALVDIDPELSKESLIQLSKILRYVLYESNHDFVPMRKEVEFMENYCQLMRIRYTDKLRFSVSTPDDGSGVSVPPLVFISFVENAFKHGVSYQKPSFIEITGERYEGKHNERRLKWTCRNSKHPKPTTDDSVPQQGGVGMANVKQRLDLIFGKNYSLDIHETDDSYEVLLDIPLGNEK